ncbi:hypothetical protein [Aquimarina sp. 2201CG5-10]|uniref:hypothetical protein n=1 Tax=Aquimarina callyspongiae TaxID=3098150 RepID=UPI002AB4B4D9|nr:hypothetical protein [Aquimarina sp. 2201CG5-10]MDY8137541.1 hypothetical protein [Aquimarina sp. 2201CG5-10]
MKNTILVLVLIVAFVSCKTEKKEEAINNELKKEKTDVIAPVLKVQTASSGSPQKPIGERPLQMKDFDFLIGNWALESTRFLPDGTVKGEYKGKWEAQLLDDGRMIFDTVTWYNSDGTIESFYPTLRTFSPKTNQWEMTYMASLSYMHSESFRGKFIDGEGHFDAVVSIAPGELINAKIRFYDIKKDTIKWSMQISADGGENWFIAERISAKRVH